MRTYRQGRMYRVSGSSENECSGIFCMFIIWGLLLGIPLFVVSSERSLYTALSSLEEVKRGGVKSLTVMSAVVGSVVGLQSHGGIHATATDAAFMVVVPGALNLQRRTEYCQWQEMSRQRCETCHRTAHAKDGSSSTESYSCNCVTEYWYTKGWLHHRVPSLLFNQPAAHHNPQRDPFPSASFAAPAAAFEVRPPEGADAGEGGGEAPMLLARLGTELVARAVAPEHRVEWVRGGAAARARRSSRQAGGERRSWWSGKKDRTVLEPLSALAAAWGRDAAPAGPVVHNNNNSSSSSSSSSNNNNAPYISSKTGVAGKAAEAEARRAGFAYVGQGGYFFSPYRASALEDLARASGQWLEGSLLNWQLGDLMPSCAAGDLRVSFAAQAPRSLSVVAEVLAVRPRSPGDANLSVAVAAEAAVEVSLGLHATRAGRSVGLVRAGRATPEAMLSEEAGQGARRAWLVWRLPLLLPWAAACGRLAGALLLGADLRDQPRAWLAAAGSAWLACLGLAWLAACAAAANETPGTTGTGGDGGGGGGGSCALAVQAAAAVLAAGALAAVARSHSPPPRVARGPRAAWCMVGRWAALPPEWRVETSYKGAAASPVPSDTDEDDPAAAGATLARVIDGRSYGGGAVDSGGKERGSSFSSPAALALEGVPMARPVRSSEGPGGGSAGNVSAGNISTGNRAYDLA